MRTIIRKLIYLSVALGLFGMQPVPAIDVDYPNPYVNNPETAQDDTRKWTGVISYGGKDKKLPPMTLVGAGLLLMGIGTGGYCLLRSRRQGLSA